MSAAARECLNQFGVVDSKCAVPDSGDRGSARLPDTDFSPQDYKASVAAERARDKELLSQAGFPALELTEEEVHSVDHGAIAAVETRQIGTHCERTYPDGTKVETDENNRTVAIRDGDGVTFTPDKDDPNLWHSDCKQDWKGWPVVDGNGKLWYQPAEGSPSTPFQSANKDIFDDLSAWWKSL